MLKPVQSCERLLCSLYFIGECILASLESQSQKPFLRASESLQSHFKLKSKMGSEG